jgi:hypothetical protein
MGESIRFIAIVVGALLLGLPLLLGSVWVILAVDGSALLGLLLYRLQLKRTGQKLTLSGVFSAGLFAELFFSVAFLLGSGFYAFVASGSFEQGIGNLGGLLLTLWFILGTAASAGLALLFYGIQDPKERPASPLEALCHSSGMSVQDVKCPKCGSSRLQHRGTRWGVWINHAFDRGNVALKCLDCERRFVITKLYMLSRKPAL